MRNWIVNQVSSFILIIIITFKSDYIIKQFYKIMYFIAISYWRNIPSWPFLTNIQCPKQVSCQKAAIVSPCPVGRRNSSGRSFNHRTVIFWNFPSLTADNLQVWKTKTNNLFFHKSVSFSPAWCKKIIFQFKMKVTVHQEISTSIISKFLVKNIKAKSSQSRQLRDNSQVLCRV